MVKTSQLYFLIYKIDQNSMNKHIYRLCFLAVDVMRAVFFSCEAHPQAAAIDAALL